jgi:bilirubin oxidase
MSVHVHGQYNRAPFDGWASDWAVPNWRKDYYWPNAQNARTIWYHVSVVLLDIQEKSQVLMN